MGSEDVEGGLRRDTDRLCVCTVKTSTLDSKPPNAKPETVAWQERELDEAFSNIHEVDDMDAGSV